MKSIWTMLSVLAVANLLALLALVGWLKASDRLDATRMREVRQLFTETVAQRSAREKEEAAKVEAEKKAAELKAKEGTPPVTAAEKLDIKIHQSEADQARIDAARREIRLLQETLRREKLAVESEWAKLKQEQADFDRARKIVAETEGSAQFKKTLATIEGLKPDKAYTALQQLIDAKNVDQVVSYLNAMQERTRTKVVDEFLKTDPKVAADLLERLRTRGMTVSAAGAAPG
ncbi:MAG: hypothetical protein ACKVW3_02985 [Phycisphaerales bacterium]